jgi:hypothetical protein
MKPDVRVFRDVNELSRQMAEATVRIINETVQTNGNASLALSSGKTPRTLYRLISSQFRDQILWTHVHVFWGGERCVPLGDPPTVTTAWRGRHCSMPFRVRLRMCILCGRNCVPRRSGVGLREDAAELFLQRLAAFRPGFPRARRRWAYGIAFPGITCPRGDEALGGRREHPSRGTSATDADVARTYSRCQRVLPGDRIEQGTSPTPHSPWVA